MKMRMLRVAPLVVCLAITAALAAEKAAPLNVLGKMPVKEISVFKDGHVFVVQEGAMPTDAAGNVLLDQLPNPVIGTFWPYATDKNVKLGGVVASQRRVLVQRTALSLRELLEANLGATGMITEINTNHVSSNAEIGERPHYEATILGFPTRSAEELATNSPPNSGDKLPEKGSIVLLKTAIGIKAVNIDRIQDFTFKHDPSTSTGNEEFRNLLTLKLDWNGRKPSQKTDVGMIYLQKGIRWIPSYKVTIDGKGNAVVKFQATILNELTDLVDTSVNLIIGVPTFAFKETVDPIGLQQSLAQLSQYFQSDTQRNSVLAANFSNAIMTQTARMGEFRQRGEGQAGAGEPELPEGAKNEDLFVFSIKRLTLKKGERVVVPVAEFTLPYKDVYTLDLPFAPPPEVRGNLNNSQQQELARLFSAPKVMHKIRLTNKSTYPLTTAPALLIRDNRVLSQGMMTYTSPSAESDLTITTAIDISVKKSDVETKRTPNAIQQNGASYTRVDMAGKIKLTNHRTDTVQLEVTRHVLGLADEADHDGKVEKINVFEDGGFMGAGEYPYWWHWYGWPSWWNYFNGVARITWNANLEAGKDVELSYAWHYFWR